MEREIHLFDEAVEQVRELLPLMETEMLPVQEAAGRVLAQPCTARVHVPPFARSMMDGFAVHSDESTARSTFRVVGVQAAGEAALRPIGPGETVRVMTGAPVPPGSDAVARFEWCDVNDDQMTLLRPVVPGESVQPAGDDGTAGSVLMPSGRRLTQIDVAVLRTFGVAAVTVRRRLRVSVVVTGSELVADPQQSLQPGQIYGANDALVTGALEEDGCAVLSVDYVPDDPDAIAAILAKRAEAADVVITTGGVSTGDFDYIPGTLERLGFCVSVRKVLMRPGSPFVAARRGHCTAFGLSGNPAACFTQFESLVRPALLGALGINQETFPEFGILDHDLALKPVKHVRILRAHAHADKGRIRVDAQMAQSSGVVSSFTGANCLIRLNDSAAVAGALVPLRWFRR